MCLSAEMPPVPSVLRGLQSSQAVEIAQRCCLACRRKVKANMAKMWQKVYDQNYHKSLDHRSFYFKQVRRAADDHAKLTCHQPFSSSASVNNSSHCNGLKRGERGRSDVP